MRALQFKIALETLTLKEWDRWGTRDQKHIINVAEDNKLRIWVDKEFDEIIFEGKPQNLYFFMTDLSFRYDIELI